MSLKNRVVKLESRIGPPDLTKLTVEEIEARMREIWERASESGRLEIIALAKTRGYAVENGLWRKTNVP